MERYWVYIDSRVQGPLEVSALSRLSGFTLLTQVCAESDGQWRVADDVIDIKSYFVSPPRVSSIPFIVGNTALKVEPVPLPVKRIEPSLVEELPPLDALKTAGPSALEKPGRAAEPGALPKMDDSMKPNPAPAGGSLRLTCSLCGYKNPRDVAVCMKCGGALDVPPPTVEAPNPVVEPAADPTAPTLRIEKPAEVMEKATDSNDIETPTLQEGMALDLPAGRIVAIVATVAVLGAAALFGQRWWKAHHKPKTRHVAAAVASVASADSSEDTASSPPAARTRTARHKTHHARATVAALPGVNDGSRTPDASSPSETASTPDLGVPVGETDTPKPMKKKSKPASAADAAPDSDQSGDDPASYHVVSEATPLKHRQSSPIDSPYAKKRRADRGLWSNQEDQAIQQVQQFRIYGGQRTIQRNAEILMQILRDREYNAGFETGRRPYFYNDSDWSATPKDGPMYEVHLTFSGGHELDGTARKPLKFAFDADLERGTVDPGGVDQIRSNTLHAFFDESRIPPDERRAIAKDTEDLVLAGQPDASPLALDTVVRHFVGTYGSDAVARVARAFGLTLVTKKMTHDPTLANDGASAPLVSKRSSESASEPASAPAITDFEKAMGGTHAMPSPSAVDTQKKVASTKAEGKTTTATFGSIDYQMTRGEGKERRLEVHVPSRASIGALWEALTSYDRYKQFVPDILESDREGQDGSAIIVHTISLTRFMFFVFKVNLHLRIVEHPTEHALEFERIAGEFENFRGSVQIGVDPTTRQPTMTFRATVVPQGKIPDWVFRDMAQRLVVPILDAIRARAEAT